MLSNGWYWDGEGHESMAYPAVGWKIRCRWEEVRPGVWSMVLTARESDPAPWMPGEADYLSKVSVLPEMDGRWWWDSPDRRVMEELSRRVGRRRMLQVLSCCHREGGVQATPFARALRYN